MYFRTTKLCRMYQLSDHSIVKEYMSLKVLATKNFICNVHTNKLLFTYINTQTTLP